MSNRHCPTCGEEYSDTYRTCPFCEEEAAIRRGKPLRRRGGKRVEKRQLKMPETITGVIHCKNPRCITSVEQELPQVFKLTDRANRVYRCRYCEAKAAKSGNL